MTLPARHNHNNAILASLPAGELSRLIPFLRPAPLTRNKVLQTIGDEIELIYFPSEGLASEAVSMSDGGSLEVLTIGREGAIGTPSLFGSMVSKHEVTVQITGAAWCAPVSLTKRILESCPVFQTALNKYLQSSFMQASQIAACTGRHTVPQRCASKLIRTSARSGLRSLPLTHETLAHALGVRRAGVTSAMIALEQVGSIRSMRGSVEILDIERLEDAACECCKCHKPPTFPAQFQPSAMH